MRTENLRIILILIIGLSIISCKTTKTDNILKAPDTWRKEVLEFPLIFAKSLPYKGEEHIRFAEGWGDIKSREYFSYVFVWILEKNPDLTISKLESDMDVYFTGLMKMGLLTKFRFFKKLPKTKVIFKKSKTSNAHFEGNIEVYDAFFKKEKILLNIKVSEAFCSKINKHIIYFRLSPKKFKDTLWNDLNKVDIEFNCENDL